MNDRGGRNTEGHEIGERIQFAAELRVHAAETGHLAVERIKEPGQYHEPAGRDHLVLKQREDREEAANGVPHREHTGDHPPYIRAFPSDLTPGCLRPAAGR